MTQIEAAVGLNVFYTFMSYFLCFNIWQCAFGNHSHREARKSKYVKFYLTKIAKYQKDAAGFIEFLNGMVKYEKKL